jgi:small subunit ribosomal protein S3
MGQKVNPIGFRLGINKNWDSRWFKTKHYSSWIIEDNNIRTYIKKTQKLAGIAKIVIERAGEKCKIGIHTSKPGIIIGKKGLGIEQLKSQIKLFCKSEIFINIYEVKIPEINAQLISFNIAQQIEKRTSFRRSIKRALSAAQKIGIKGIKISCSGRLGGAEMSRQEWYKEGQIPLQTIRANIEYGISVAKTSYGLIGCKVWLFKGEILKF